MEFEAFLQGCSTRVHVEKQENKVHPSSAMARLLQLDDDYFLNQFSNRAPVTVRIN